MPIPDYHPVGTAWPMSASWFEKRKIERAFGWNFTKMRDLSHASDLGNKSKKEVTAAGKLEDKPAMRPAQVQKIRGREKIGNGQADF